MVDDRSKAQDSARTSMNCGIVLQKHLPGLWGIITVGINLLLPNKAVFLKAALALTRPQLAVPRQLRVNERAREASRPSVRPILRCDPEAVLKESVGLLSGVRGRESRDVGGIVDEVVREVCGKGREK